VHATLGPAGWRKTLSSYDTPCLVHIWNSYSTPFSFCTPSGTLNPAQACKFSWDARVQLPPAAASDRKSGMKVSQSSNAGERMRVSRTRSTNESVGFEGDGKASVSRYSDAPPMMNRRCKDFPLMLASAIPSTAEARSGRRYVGATSEDELRPCESNCLSLETTQDLQLILFVTAYHYINSIAKRPEFWRNALPCISSHYCRVYTSFWSFCRYSSEVLHFLR